MFTKRPDKGASAFDRLRPGARATSEPASAASTESETAPPAASKFQGTDKMTPSIIGSDLTVMGNVVSKGEVQVDGEIQGDVHCASLVVGEKAQITGGIVAEDVVVRGRVMGSIRGMRVTLQSSSHVEGDIFHQSLAIEQGAFFEGKSRRSDDPTAGVQKLEVPAGAASNNKTDAAPAVGNAAPGLQSPAVS